ncbi:MAG: hypothetical protein Salg2KO_17590 [Salibacteraceae bacterium]
MKTILIVEDDTGIRESLKDILELSGYAVLTTTNGKEGLDEVMKANPDLVLCDVNMPELNGYEMLDALSDRLPLYLMPVFIFLTAKVEDHEIRKAFDLGADDYITKPFDHKELLQIIENKLKGKETQ